MLNGRHEVQATVVFQPSLLEGVVSGCKEVSAVSHRGPKEELGSPRTSGRLKVLCHGKSRRASPFRPFFLPSPPLTAAYGCNSGATDISVNHKTALATSTQHMSGLGRPVGRGDASCFPRDTLEDP